ncbi:hypothetical protein [Brevundimonas sp.]|uniref:hypothetical protein n=1 Tax=Brevundimonas sp. TaxID=1871086 RepID=UPI003BABF427
MRYRLIAAPACALLLTAATASAAQQSATVVRQGDPELTCIQMSEEAAEISARMGEGEGGGLLGRVGAVAKTGASMLVPGVGLAIAGADAVTAPGRERREAEAQADRDRWNYLNGLYAGKNCNPEQTAEASEMSAAGSDMAAAGSAPSPSAPVLAAPAAPEPAPAVTAPAIHPAGPL